MAKLVGQIRGWLRWPLRLVVLACVILFYGSVFLSGWNGETHFGSIRINGPVGGIFEVVTFYLVLRILEFVLLLPFRLIRTIVRAVIYLAKVVLDRSLPSDLKFLSCAAVLIPRAERSRWLEDFEAELDEIPPVGPTWLMHRGGSGRRRFVLQQVTRTVPWLALTARRRARGRRWRG